MPRQDLLAAHGLGMGMAPSAYVLSRRPHPVCFCRLAKLVRGQVRRLKRFVFFCCIPFARGVAAYITYAPLVLVRSKHVLGQAASPSLDKEPAQHRPAYNNPVHGRCASNVSVALHDGWPFGSTRCNHLALIYTTLCCGAARSLHLAPAHHTMAL